MQISDTRIAIGPNASLTPRQGLLVMLSIGTVLFAEREELHRRIKI